VIVLDTHAWIWWVGDPARLGRTSRVALRDARRIGIPAICCLEVAMLVARGRLSLDRPARDWMLAAIDLPKVELLPLTPAVAALAVELPATFPGDPADRVIVASALIEHANLVTRDRRIVDAGLVSTLW
jgi:PIN domain nuclease of toxin-antitoxin system